MYCNKCGRFNSDTSKFCMNCGQSLERRTFEQPINTNITNNVKPGSSTLSIISLVFLSCQFVFAFLLYKIEFLSSLISLPWLPVSLVLAIISKCKYNDKLSLVVIIIDSILIVIGIIIVIIALLFFAALFEALIVGCNGIAA